MKNYREIIKDNNEKGAFNDATNLSYFLDNYTNAEGDNVKKQEDNINEYADGLVPVYNYEIVKEWQENADCHELTLEVTGEYNQKEGIIKMMMSDLFYFYEQELREDYNKLIELIEEEEETEAIK